MNNFDQATAKVFEENNKRIEDKINNPEHGLAVKLKNLKQMMEENKKAFASEFPNIDLDDSKTISFLEGHDTDKVLFDNMKTEYEKLKKEIFELNAAITLVETREEN